jgi:hypothetical protein
MALLKVVRECGYVDRLRAYQVVLDGQKIAGIRDGETKEIPVSAGEHLLSLKIDWCGSKTIKFLVADGDTATFYAKSNLGGAKVFLALWYVFFDRHSYLLIEPAASQVSAGRT